MFFWGYRNLDLWPPNSNQVILESKWIVCVLFEGIPSRWSWDIVFIRMGTDRQPVNIRPRATGDRETHCFANEVGVEAHPLTPKRHQLWGGKLFRHQAGDGLTAAASHDSNKVLHGAADCGVLWKEKEWLQHSSIGSFVFCRLWILTSHLIQQGIAGSTLNPRWQVNTKNVGSNLQAWLGAGLDVFQRII